MTAKARRSQPTDVTGIENPRQPSSRRQRRALAREAARKAKREPARAITEETKP